MCVDMCLCECMPARTHTQPASAVLRSGCEVVVAAILAGEQAEAGQGASVLSVPRPGEHCARSCGWVFS